MTRQIDLSAGLDELRRASDTVSWKSSRFPDALAGVIRRHGLWKLWVPERFGGAQLDLPASLALFESAAAIEGSLGFALAIGAGGGLFAAYLPEQTAAEIFTPAEALIAGSGVPGGLATPADGGFRVTGRWKYASLIHQATWVTANTRRSDTDEIMAVAVPATVVDVADDWAVHALSVTDSQSIELRNVLVPAVHTFSLAAAPRIEAPLYRFPFEALAAAAFASVSVGIAAAGLDAFAADSRLRTGPHTPANTVREERLARGWGKQRAAAAYLAKTVQDAWQQLRADGLLRERSETAVHLAAVSATSLAVAAVEQVAEVSGMPLLDTDNRLSRCWRDLHGIAQHTLISPARQAELGARMVNAES